MEKILIDRALLEQALEAHQALREWIKAVPQTVSLPAMPGMDGDWLDTVEDEMTEALDQPRNEKMDNFIRTVGNSPRYEVANAAQAVSEALASTQAPADVPSSDWRLVPVRPTSEMLRATVKGYAQEFQAHRMSVSETLYRTMIEAAPKPPASMLSEVQQAPAKEESFKLYGYVWSEEFHGGCFVYPHENHPKNATAVYEKTDKVEKKGKKK